MKNLRASVSELMAEIHLIPAELAELLVSEMDDIEIVRRFCMYTGMELSAAERTKESDPDFYQVFGFATATARPAALNPVSGVSLASIGAGPSSLPELDQKTWSDGGAGR